MTVPQRVDRRRQADADRRKVNSRGKRVTRKPQARKPTAKRPTRKRSGYAKGNALAGLSVMFSAFSFMTGSILWGVGAVASAGASSVAWRIEYKRQLAEVKATGKPIGGKAGDPLPAGVKPVELDPPPRQPARKPAAKPGGDHATRCKANPPGGPTCRCVDGPNRGGARKTTTKRTTTRKKP